MTHQPNNVSAADEKILWSATPDGMACRKEFEIAQGQPRFDVEFNPTTEHYQRDNGIGFLCIATDTEWRLWQKAWRAAASAQATTQAAPIYQTCFIKDQWRDVDRVEYDRAKSLRSDLARIVYAAPSPVSREAGDGVKKP